MDIHQKEVSSSKSCSNDSYWEPTSKSQDSNTPNIMDQITQFVTLQKKLVSLGSKLTEVEFVHRLMIKFPDSFSAFVTQFLFFPTHLIWIHFLACYKTWKQGRKVLKFQVKASGSKMAIPTTNPMQGHQTTQPTRTSPIIIVWWLELRVDLKTTFEMTDLGLLHYFIGMEVYQSHGGIFLSQHRYLRQLLETYSMSNCRPLPCPMDPNSKLSREDNFSHLWKYYEEG